MSCALKKAVIVIVFFTLSNCFFSHAVAGALFEFSGQIFGRPSDSNPDVGVTNPSALGGFVYFPTEYFQLPDTKLFNDVQARISFDGAKYQFVNGTMFQDLHSSRLVFGSSLSENALAISGTRTASVSVRTEDQNTGRLFTVSLPRDFTAALSLFPVSTNGIDRYAILANSVVGRDIDDAAYRLLVRQSGGTVQKVPAQFDQNYYDALVQGVMRPEGILKVWDNDTKEFVAINQDGAGSKFDKTKGSVILANGWNGIGSEDFNLKSGSTYSLKEDHPWTSEVAASLSNNALSKAQEKNILAFDWTAAASSFNSNDYVPEAEAVASKAYLKMHPEAPQECSANYFTCKSIFQGESDWIKLHEAASRYMASDFGPPDTQTKPQGDALAKQISGLYGNPPKGAKIEFIGHSLGAGVVTYAARSLVDSGLMMQNIERLTLLDPPENSVAGFFGGRVLLDSVLEGLKNDAPSIAIENIVANNGFASSYGKPYAKGVFNFIAELATHLGNSIGSIFYKSTIDYSTNKENWVQNHPKDTVPDGIGYSLSSEDMIARLTRSSGSVSCSFGAYRSLLDVDPLTGDIADEFGRLNCSDTDGSSSSYVRTIGGPAEFWYVHTGENGQIETVDFTAAPTLISHSPVYAYADYFVSGNTYGLSINFRPENWSDGDKFGIWVNDFLLYMLDAKFFDSNGNWTGILDISEWANSWITLTFGLIANDSGHRIDVNSIEFFSSSVNSSSVPIPSTLLLVFTALCLANRNGRMIRHRCCLV